jgi:hypothetical protein
VNLVKQKTYKKVFDIACEDILRLDIKKQARNCGVRMEEIAGGTRLDVPCFDEIIGLTVPGFSFTSSKASSVNLVTRIVVLHHLSRGSGTPLQSEPVSYEDIDPGMRHYLPVFERRVVKPLITAFGYNRDAFLQSGTALGGKPEAYGNGSFTLYAMPRVPITFILWEGDEEFPPSMKILFNPTVSEYLPLEDIVVISKLAAGRIIKAAKLKYAEEVIE